MFLFCLVFRQEVFFFQFNIFRYPLFWLRPAYWRGSKSENLTTTVSALEISNLKSIEDEAEYIEPVDRSALKSAKAFAVITAKNLRKDYLVSADTAKEEVKKKRKAALERGEVFVEKQKTFATFFEKPEMKTVIEDVNLELHSGQTLALLGHNGIFFLDLSKIRCWKIYIDQHDSWTYLTNIWKCYDQNRRSK